MRWSAGRCANWSFCAGALLCAEYAEIPAPLSILVRAPPALGLDGCNVLVSYCDVLGGNHGTNRSAFNGQCNGDGFEDMEVYFMRVCNISDVICIDVSLLAEAFEATSDPDISVFSTKPC